LFIERRRRSSDMPPVEGVDDGTSSADMYGHSYSGFEKCVKEMLVKQSYFLTPFKIPGGGCRIFL
jgi:hypothetical protein